MRSRLMASALVLLVAGCESIPQVPTPPASAQDATPPALRLGSAGLKKEFLLVQTSTAPELRRAKRGAEIFLMATAEDPESGIEDVTFDITQSVNCGTVGHNQTFSETLPAPSDRGLLPTRLTKSYTIRLAPLRARCGNGPSSVTVSVTASAKNGVGQITTLPAGRVTSFGPDVLRVGTFNLYWPGNHPDSTYQRWGRELGATVDVMMLTEVLDQRRAELVAHEAGMPYVIKAPDGDVAVSSRWPLYDVQTRVIDPPGTLTSANSHVMSVMTDIDGSPHQFIAAHWGIRDGDGDALRRGPHEASPFRMQAAQAMIGLMSTRPGLPIFAGGDFNAYSGVGPQDHDGNANTPDFVAAVPEVDMLRTRFTDPFISLGVTDYCSNNRIDYVLLNGPYAPVSVETCPFFTSASPSDHPFVRATFEAGD